MDFVANLAGKRKRKLTILPLLVVLFIFSYYLLTKLVIEQDKTRESQRSLIHQLFKDNVYLSKFRKHVGDTSSKNKAFSSSQLHTGISSRAQSSEVQSAQVPLIEVPLNQVPLTQVPLTQVPPNKTGSQAKANTGRKARKSDRALPKPAEPTDPSDMRRILFSISLRSG